MTKVNRVFSCTITDIEAAARIIQGALRSEHGPEVSASMGPTFEAEFDARCASLAEAIGRQSGAKGNLHLTTVNRWTAIDETGLHMGAARAIAKLVFKSNRPVLHDEFAVGHPESESIVAFISRAEQIRAGCAKYAEIMAANGWLPARTAKLGGLIDVLKTAHVSREGAPAWQKGATAEVINLANALYQQIRLVQIVANVMYPAKSIAIDASIIKARDSFLLGIFPFGERANSGDSTPLPAPAGEAVSGSTEATGAGGTA